MNHAKGCGKIIWQVVGYSTGSIDTELDKVGRQYLVLK